MGNNYFDINISRDNITIYIYTSPYLINIAHYISKNFEKYNIKNYVNMSLITNDIFDLINYDDNSYLFLLAFQSFYNSPIKDKLIKMRKNKYILYQLEQINNNTKYNKNISYEMEIFMENALYVLEYNITNYNMLNNKINKLFVGVPIVEDNNVTYDKDIDILFYGNVNNYRKIILDNLLKKYNIKILEKSFGIELKEYIMRSKIILNIHYYKEALLEICRIHEAIPYKCKIISEISPNDLNLCEKYNDFCIFIDFTNNNEVVKIIDNELQNYHNNDFDYIIKKNFLLYNENFEKFTKKIKYYNLFSKELLNIKNSTFNYKLSLIDKDYNVVNICQKFVKNENNILDKKINIDFKSERHYSLYLDIISKGNKNIINEEYKINRKIIDNIAHLHCYDLSNFDEIYGNYLLIITKYFTPIITYCIISKKQNGYTIDNKYIILEIENRGMDIGGKFCLVDYLMKNNIEYKYILFLHSKSNLQRRIEYFSFINDTNIKETLSKIDENVDGIFPNLVINGDWNTKKWYINKVYTEDLLEYLKCDIENKKFVEGNCMILSYRIIKKIFEDNLFLYELLNKKESFDLNWFSWYYKEKGNFLTNYEKYIKNNVYGNNLSHNYKKNIGSKNYTNIAKLNSLDGYKLPDGMLEHAFERIYLNVIDSFLDGKYHVVGNNMII
jgi:hypothetical protein